MMDSPLSIRLWPEICIAMLCAFQSRILCGSCATHSIWARSREEAIRWNQGLQLLLISQQPSSLSKGPCVCSLCHLPTLCAMRQPEWHGLR